MQVDILLDNVKAYNIEKADVLKGQSFTLETDGQANFKWFSDNDPVLSMEINATTGILVAKELGMSTILIMNEAMQIVKTIVITVVQEILPTATDLGLSAGEPENK